MNDEEIRARSLEAWPAAEPPPGFAERVVAARRPWRRPSRARRIAIAAAVLLAAFAAARVAHQRRPLAGQTSAAARETIALGGRGIAVAEAGTRLSWAVSGAGDARIEQPEGNAFYRVEPGGPFVVAAPGAEITALGTCFRVEVVEMATATENARAGLIGAAAASLVLVTVYEGRVRVYPEGAPAAVELGAGEQRRFAVPPTAANPAPSLPPTALAHAAISSTPAPAADPSALRARIAQLEAQVSQLAAAKAAEPQPEEGLYKVRGFTPDELRALAEKCELRMGSPMYGASPPSLEPDKARSLSVPASEADQINQILAAQNTEFVRSMRAIYLAATGDTAGADQLDVPAMEQEIFSKSRPEQLAAARQELAREKAGLASAPADPSREAAAVRMYRLMDSADDKLNDALAASLGNAEADRLLDTLTPSHTSMNGCPDGAR